MTIACASVVGRWTASESLRPPATNLRNEPGCMTSWKLLPITGWGSSPSVTVTASIPPPPLAT